jgi:hypothetical protein
MDEPEYGNDLVDEAVHAGDEDVDADRAWVKDIKLLITVFYEYNAHTSIVRA